MTTPKGRKLVLDNIRCLIRQQNESFGCTAEIRESVPSAMLTNDGEEARKACRTKTYHGSGDFAFMLQQRKNTHCFLGNGDTKFVHNPEYVLDQQILPVAPPIGWH